MRLTRPEPAQYKTSDVASRSSGLVRVNLYKDLVSNTGRLPSLPHHAQLRAQLETPYWHLANGYEKSRGKAIYALPAARLALAGEFLQVPSGSRPDLRLICAPHARCSASRLFVACVI